MPRGDRGHALHVAALKDDHLRRVPELVAVPRSRIASAPSPSASRSASAMPSAVGPCVTKTVTFWWVGGQRRMPCRRSVELIPPIDMLLQCP